MSRSLETEFTTELIILGSGPCGLGAAWRAAHFESGQRPGFLVVDRSCAAGGSAASVTTAEGFTFDLGGHILYPHEHYSDFKALLDDLVPEWHQSKPVRGVWMDGRLIPYPLQRNLHHLPIHKLSLALWGLLAVRWRERFGPHAVGVSANLESYLHHHFGGGLTRVALGPINRKMWAHELRELGSEWTSQRSGSRAPNVSNVSIREILSSIITRRDNLGWTESTRVRYPARGGTGSIWTALANRIGKSRMINETVAGIDPRLKIVRFASGRSLGFRHMISTVPLDVLIDLLDENEDIVALGTQLRYAQAGFVGFGLRGTQPSVLQGVHSFHLPETNIDCWRITVSSNLAPGNAPPGNFWSMLCEVSAPWLQTHMNIDAMAENILARLRGCGLVPRTAEVVSRWTTTMQHGYPIPFVGRDAILREINVALWHRDILSRGRFGGWKYEVSNQDHTFMQGVEAVDLLYARHPETTYRFPEAVN